MNKYKVKLLASAARDIEEIYNYIADEFKVIETAERMVDLLEHSILGLDEMPYRGSESITPPSLCSKKQRERG